MLRINSLGGGLAALALSGIVHAAALLAPMGHASQDPGQGGVLVEVPELTPTPDAPIPEPTVTPPAGPAPIWPTHTHPYPVPASHDWAPHDPALVHPHAPAAQATPEAPAQAAEAITASDDSPRFTIAIGTGEDAYGAVSKGGTAAPHAETGDPVPEQSVDAPARLVMGLAPSYPDAARSDGVEGDVRLELVVGVAGTVESARVVRSVGHGLDEAALLAVHQFRFAPATKAGRPVRVRMGWSIEFRLR